MIIVWFGNDVLLRVSEAYKNHSANKRKREMGKGSKSPVALELTAGGLWNCPCKSGAVTEVLNSDEIASRFIFSRNSRSALQGAGNEGLLV